MQAICIQKFNFVNFAYIQMRLSQKVSPTSRGSRYENQLIHFLLIHELPKKPSG